MSYQPDDPTALLRLAEISLSRGEYDAARPLLERAITSWGSDPTTRLLYGDMLVADGKQSEAAGVLRGVPWAAGRLNWQAWYRYGRVNDLQRAASAWQTVLLLDPGNPEAKGWLEKIR